MEVVSMARKGVNAAAQKAFDSWASMNDYPTLSEILPSYLDDHDSILLETILLEFGGFLLTEFKGAKSTKEKYFESVIFLLRRANKGHSIDNDAEVSRLSLALKNHLNREKIIDGDDITTEKTLPLFIVDDLPYAIETSSPHLAHITNEMFKKKDHSGRLATLLTFYADGRAGEGKALSYNNWHWDAVIGALVCNWNMVKVLETKKSSFCASARYVIYVLVFITKQFSKHFTHYVFITIRFEYSLDCFHALGTYWALSDGLYRDTPSRTNNFLFNNIQNRNRNYFSCIVTTSLKGCVGVVHKGFISGKSLRYGATTTMAMHPEMTDGLVRSRGGWKQDNSSIYTVSVLSSVLPGMKVLSGYLSIYDQVAVPSFERVLSTADIALARKFTKKVSYCSKHVQQYIDVH